MNIIKSRVHGFAMPRVSQRVHEFQGPLESLDHFKKRVPSKSKSEFRKIHFGVFLEQFQDVWTS